MVVSGLVLSLRGCSVYVLTVLRVKAGLNLLVLHVGEHLAMAGEAGIEGALLDVLEMLGEGEVVFEDLCFK